MRSKWWLILLALVVVAGNLRLSFSVAKSKPAAQANRPVAKAASDGGDNIVDGYGLNAAAAKAIALKHAEERVEKLLRQRFEQTGWKPPAEQLTSDYLIHYGVVQPQGEPKEAEGLDGEKMQVARYKVELTKEYLQEVRRVAREQRVQERHLVALRVLAGLVVVFLVVTGYFRLEDMTRGYATQLLRAVAIGLVTLAVLALWLTM
jgi:hypothetical protein